VFKPAAKCDLQHAESPHSTGYRSCIHAKQELQRRRNLRATTQVLAGGSISRNTQQMIDHSSLLLVAPISSFGSNHENKNSNRLQEKTRIRTPIKHQFSRGITILAFAE
jgi:hypothetical protein